MILLSESFAFIFREHTAHGSQQMTNNGIEVCLDKRNLFINPFLGWFFWRKQPSPKPSHHTKKFHYIIFQDDALFLEAFISGAAPI